MDRKAFFREKRRKAAEKRRQLRRQMRSCAQDILRSPNFRGSAALCQHGRVSVRSHSLMVAECSLQIRQNLMRLGIESREKELVRGALLHDYFLYDWHDPDPGHRFHGFRHPAFALRNVRRDWRANRIEAEIIRRHMFPLTPIPPLCREGLLVCLVDKGCGLAETLWKHRYRRLKKLCGDALRAPRTHSETV